jgi:hypothetical protein
MTGESTAENDPESRHESFRHEHRKIPKRAYFLALAGLAVGLFTGFSAASPSIPPAPLPSSASPLKMKDPTDWTIPGNGVYIVGSSSKGGDVRPGLYRARDNRECSWRTSSDATFERVSLVASDTSSGDAYVELKAGEFFDTNGCTTWRRVTGPGAPR